MSRQSGFTLWLTGLSGAGKSTLASAVGDLLVANGRLVEILDGDQIGTTLSRDLGFSKADRDANVHRIGFVARLLSRNGIVAIAAAIAPYRDARDEVRRAHQTPFIEAYVDCAIDVLERRDTKKFYAKARTGELCGFTGVSDPYEPPLAPEIHLRTDREDVPTARDRIVRFLSQRRLL